MFVLRHIDTASVQEAEYFVSIGNHTVSSSIWN